MLVARSTVAADAILGSTPVATTSKRKLILGQAGKSLGIIAVLFLFESVLLSLFFHSLNVEAGVATVLKENLFPNLSAHPQASIITRASNVRSALLDYSHQHAYRTALAILLCFVYLQTFALPGTSGLGLLAGAFFGCWTGLALIAVSTMLGALSCYTLSFYCGKDLAYAIWPERMKEFAAQVKERELVLLNYIIFLRLTPFLPNTFINAAAPIVGVPVFHFALGTFVGSSASNFLVVNAGSHLTDITSLRDLYSLKIVLIFAAMAALALLPVLMRHRWVRKDH